MPDAVTLILFALVGLVLGSFGNVLLFRVNKRRSIGGRSACPHCRHALAWYDLVPVLSFMLLCARCRHCHRSISWQYPLVELASAAVFALAYIQSGGDLPQAIANAVVLYGLLLTAIFDAKHEKIPDMFTAIVASGALLRVIVSGAFLSSAEGAVLVFVWFGAQWLVSKGKYVGSGDIFLGAAIGLWLGWKDAVVMLFASYILGSIVALILLVRGKATFHTSRLSFGPFLALGALLAYLGVGDAYFSLL